jgi:hypothetical protein
MAKSDRSSRRLETPQQVRKREVDQERRGLRRFLKSDGRFAGIAQTAYF